MTKFKQGDRVCVIKKSSNLKASSCHRQKVDSEFTLKAFNPIGCYWHTREGVDFYEHEISHALLKIEAGKYYRTRDGRKVGPMSEDGISEFPWHGTSQSSGLESYRNDGSWSLEAGKPDCRDLIAEWVEAPVDDANEKSSLLPVTLKLSEGSLTMVVSEFKMPTIKSSSIVARIDNGQPMPAARPLVHDTKEEAEKEAKRLSEKHRGKEFGVFTLIAKHQTEAVYDHEWQRLAANGNKIGAIKAIRELTGFGLKAAKDGLEDWLSRNAA